MGDLSDKFHEMVGLGLTRHPVALEELWQRVARIVVAADGVVIGLKPAAANGNPREETFVLGVDEDRGVEHRSRDALGFGSLWTGDGLGIYPDVEATFVENSWRRFVGENIDGFDSGAPGLEAEAGLAGVEHAGIAPGAVGPFGEDYAVAVFQAKEKSGLKLVGNDDGLGLAQHCLRDGVAGIFHEFAEDGFTGFEPRDIVIAREGALGLNCGGGKEGNKDDGKESLHNINNDGSNYAR